MTDGGQTGFRSLRNGGRAKAHGDALPLIGSDAWPPVAPAPCARRLGRVSATRAVRPGRSSLEGATPPNSRRSCPRPQHHNPPPLPHPLLLHHHAPKPPFSCAAPCCTTACSVFTTLLLVSAPLHPPAPFSRPPWPPCRAQLPSRHQCGPFLLPLLRASLYPYLL